jgi:hypothetical protein
MSSKRGIPIILLVALFLVLHILFLPVTLAQGATVAIDDGSAAPNEEDLVSIMINDVPVDIMTADLTLTYDNSVVHVMSVSNGQFDNVLSTINNGTGSTRIVAFQTASAPLTGNVKLCDVTLKAVGSAGESSQLTITIGKLEAGDESVITATPDNGTFTIEVNNPPHPNITNPQDGATLTGLATIEEIDESGEEDIVYNLFEYYYDEDCNGEADDGNDWTGIGNDTYGGDGWSVDWDTTQYPDCCYIIRATMGDEEGQTGEDKINVALSNHDPEPVITNPQNGSTLSGVVTIEEVDDSFEGGADIVYNLFEYYYDENCNCTADDAGSEWFEIGNDTDGGDGWSAGWDTTQYSDCCYMIRATMGDKHGRTGQDEINVKIDNTPPVVTNGNATPLIIPDDTDNEPLWGENVTLTVTVSDHSSVAVTINLSTIGGSAIQPMMNAGGNTWSVTTNASNGTAGWNGTAYVPYYLLVNATDAQGMSNTSVGIELAVMKNGDASGNGEVTLYDASYIAKWYLGQVGFETLIEDVADVSGNGEVTLYDASYIAKWYLGQAGFEVLK